MTSEREAKIWMVVAGAVVVWACTMVGCAASPLVERKAVLQPWTGPAVGSDTAIAPSITLSPDTASVTSVEATVAPLEAVDAFELLPASPPEVILLQPRPTSLPRFDVELRGLSIAQPLVSAKRLLVAAVSVLPPVPVADWDQVISAAMHAELSDQPVAASLGLSQRLSWQTPAAAVPALEFTALDRQALTRAPWPTDPTPTPTPAVSDQLALVYAKFDSAGVLMIVLGAMVLGFGGEAVVLWVKQLRRKAEQRAAAVALRAAEPEESVLRFPEPVVVDEDQTFSRAA